MPSPRAREVSGDGTFRPHRDYAVGREPFAVVAGDFNFDGKMDLAIANFSSNSVSIWLGNGDGALGTRADFAAGTQAVSVAVADFNLDGKPPMRSS